ncbi:hypothetical protein VX159_06080 [Dechloromonas sp. ZY10]|uniref:hypothetical protein n=1 Tax=Dechloromonas aquae TaxID=2664436 RepID=UPI0035296174
MFVNQTESTAFVQSLKRAGVSISDERQVIERLAEAREWHYAFSTLVKQGRRIGIWFAATAKLRSPRLQRLFARYHFTPGAEAAFEQCLQR